MYDLVTSYGPLILAFFVGTLVPRVYESFMNVFFHIPDQFLNFVNTTLVPRFGDTGGKIVLVLSEHAVAIIKLFGKALVEFAKHVLPIVLKIAEDMYDILVYSQLFESILYLLSYTVPYLKSVAHFLQSIVDEIVSFFSWTTSAMKAEFFRFGFHVALLYLSIHLLIWGIKRIVKKVV